MIKKKYNFHVYNFRNSKSLLDSSSDSTSTSDLQGKGSEIRTGQNKKYIEKGSNKTGTVRHGRQRTCL